MVTLMIVLNIPMNQMLRSCWIKTVFLGDSHVDNSSFIIWMNKFVRPLPFPVSGIILRPLPVNPTDKTGDRNPEDQGDNDHSSNNIVLEELQESLNGEIIEDLPPDVYRILTSLLTLTLVTETLEAGSSIRKNVHRSNSIT